MIQLTQRCDGHVFGDLFWDGFALCLNTAYHRISQQINAIQP